MGEIIPRPKPPSALPFTGERLTSDYGGQTEIEHMHRYLLAREWCRDKDVLDVASGEGYGTALLAQVARSATGVEIADDVVAHATSAYARDGLRFIAGDARDLPLRDASCDVVISFETIEHFGEQGRFLDEVRRVLRPGGLLIVSTPDRDNYSPAETAANPFHVRELTRGEFVALIRSRFTDVALLAQRPVFGSVLLPSGTSGPTPLCFERRGTGHFELSAGLARPQYLMAFASDGAASDLPASVYIDTGHLGVLSPMEAELRLQAAQTALDAERTRASDEAAAMAIQLAGAEETAVNAERLRADGEATAAEAQDAARRAVQAAQAQVVALQNAIDTEQVRSQDALTSLAARLSATEEAMHALRNGELLDCQTQIKTAQVQAGMRVAELAECRAELARARGEAKGLLAANEMAERGCVALRGELEKLRVAKEERERVFVALQGELKAARELAEHTCAELNLVHRSQMNSERALWQQTRAEIVAQAGQLEEDLIELRVKAKEGEDLRANILASHSWRVTAPLRWISRVIYPRP